MANELNDALSPLDGFKMPRYKELPEIELYMDQIISIAEKYLAQLSIGEKSIITPSMINNYVKNGILPPPTKKRYTRDHLAKIIIICTMKQTVEITDIASTLDCSIEENGMENTFDMFAARYENDLAQTVENAIFLASEENGSVLDVIIAGAVRSNTSRLVAEYALKTRRENNEPTDKEKEKPRSKKKKRDEDDEEEISLLPVI